MVFLHQSGQHPRITTVHPARVSPSCCNRAVEPAQKQLATTVNAKDEIPSTKTCSKQIRYLHVPVNMA